MKKYTARTTIPRATIPRTTPTIVAVLERPLPPTGRALEVGVEEIMGPVSSLVEDAGPIEVCEEGLGVPEDGERVVEDGNRHDMSPSGMRTTSKIPDWKTSSGDNIALSLYVPGGTSTFHWKAPENGLIVVLSVFVMSPGDAVVSDGGTPAFDTISVIGTCLPSNCHRIVVVSHVVLSGTISKKNLGSLSCRATSPRL